METQTVRFAPAKLNLHLAVGSLGMNGLHPIQSVFVTTSLVDTLTITCSPSADFSIDVTGLEAYCPPEEDTITQAALAYRKRRPLPFALDVHCTKRIPVRAGLGGGSSDGAAILLFLQELAREDRLPAEELIEVAKEVGSDLPFFVSGARAAIVEGSGEVVVPLPCSPYPALVVKPVDPSELKREDVITFIDPADPVRVVSHRIMDVVAGGSFITRGDANNTDDPKPVPAENILGKAEYAIPYAGYVLDFVQSTEGLIIAVLIPSLLIVVFEFRKLLQYVAMIEKEKNTGSVS